MKSKRDRNGDVDVYLAGVSEDARGALQALRETIRSAAPGAEEGFSYGVPAFKLGGRPLVCFAAFKSHCGFYPMSPDVLSSFAVELAGYDTAKGTIRFDPKEPLPTDLVRRIVRARIAELNT